MASEKQKFENFLNMARTHNSAEFAGSSKPLGVFDTIETANRLILDGLRKGDWLSIAQGAVLTEKFMAQIHKAGVAQIAHYWGKGKTEDTAREMTSAVADLLAMDFEPRKIK